MAINNSVGKEYVKQIDPFLKHVANRVNNLDEATSWTERFLRGTRLNLSKAVLAFNLPTILTPNIGRVDRILKRLGTRPMEIIDHIMIHFPEYYSAALEKSAELRNWEMDYNREASEIYQKSFGQKFENQATLAGFGILAKVEKTISFLQWHSVYQEALENGKGEAGAIILADKDIRTSFGRAGTLDLSPLMRGGEGYRLFTLFYGFGELMYNRTRRIVKQTGQGIREVKAGDFAGARRDFGRAFADSIWFIVVSAIFGAVYSPPKKNDSWGETAAKLLAGQIGQIVPFGRDLASFALQGYGPSASPPTAIITSVYKAAVDVGRLTGLSDKKPSEAYIKHMIQAPGMAFGLPGSGQAGKTAQFLWDWNRGKADVKDTSDIVKGLIYGTPHPEKR